MTKFVSLSYFNFSYNCCCLLGMLFWLAASPLFAQTKEDIYKQINQERIARGVSPIPVDKKLEKSAQSWAFFMPYRGVHNTNFRRRFKRMGGECIAWGDSPVENWIGSKPHSRIIFGKSVKAIGLGHWRGKWVLRTFTN